MVKINLDYYSKDYNIEVLDEVALLKASYKLVEAVCYQRRYRRKIYNANIRTPKMGVGLQVKNLLFGTFLCPF